MSIWPPAAARYRAAAKIASEAFQGSATPSPSASRPQRSHVDGMNCIQPTAPAELGPMFSPKFDSILLIAASTFPGRPETAPARCHSSCSAFTSSRCGAAGGVVNDTGTEMPPGVFGTAALGSETGLEPAGLDETVNPRTGGCAEADPASRASAAAATTRKRISLRLERDGAAGLRAREAAAAAAAPRAAALPLPAARRP